MFGRVFGIGMCLTVCLCVRGGVGGGYAFMFTWGIFVVLECGFVWVWVSFPVGDVFLDDYLY